MIPNHILILGSPNSGKLRIAKLILHEDDSIPEVREDETHSGIIVKTSVVTKYYSSKLNILIDEYPENRSTEFKDEEEEKLSQLKQWYTEFKSPEFAELREVLDGIVLTFNLVSDSLTFIEQALNVVEDIRSVFTDDESQWDGFLLIVGSVPEGKESVIDKEDVEDLVISHGFEFAYLNEAGVDEYKEKLGSDRIVEVMQSHEWSHMDLVKSKPEDYEKSKTSKIESMKRSLLEEKKEMGLDEIFDKLTLAKDQIRNLSEDQKKQHAKKIIDEIIDFI
ncbi:IRC6 Increased recombination centers protein 6 [Candida maltosa Xu316]